MSTDLEDPDYYTISLTANDAASDVFMVFAQGYQTTSDDYDIKGNGTHLGVAYRFVSKLELRASLDSVRPDGDDPALGATLALQFEYGGGKDRGQMFQTAITPDRFWIGAFDPHR